MSGDTAVMRNGPVKRLPTMKCCEPNARYGHHNSRSQYFASGTTLPDESLTAPSIVDCSRSTMPIPLTGPPPFGVRASA